MQNSVLPSPMKAIGAGIFFAKGIQALESELWNAPSPAADATVSLSKPGFRSPL